VSIVTSQIVRTPTTPAIIPPSMVFIYLNLDTMTAMINSTKTVIIAIVIIRFVAILRAIPLRVLILLSVYPSLSKSVSRVCVIVSLCLPRSDNVFLPISSVSSATRCESLNLFELLSNLSVPDKSCCRCSKCASPPLPSGNRYNVSHIVAP